MITLRKIHCTIFALECFHSIIRGIDWVSCLVANPFLAIEKMENPKQLQRVAYYVLEFFMFVFVFPLYFIRNIIRDYANGINNRLLDEIEVAIKAEENTLKEKSSLS